MGKPLVIIVNGLPVTLGISWPRVQKSSRTWCGFYPSFALSIP